MSPENTGLMQSNYQPVQTRSDASTIVGGAKTSCNTISDTTSVIMGKLATLF